jgi:hypothetical protein
MQKTCKVSLEQCEYNALEPQHYVWLYLIYHKEEGRAWSLSYLQKADLEYLERNGFIKVGEYILEKGYNKVTLTKKAVELFESTGNDKLFEELWSLFPQKVDDGRGGFRVLRAVSIESKDAEVCRAKYLAIIKGRIEIHSHIIKCLKAQLHAEKYKLMYLNNLQTWLNQKIWERYEPGSDPIIEDKNELL